MSEFALKIQKYYETGLWPLPRIQKALELGRITQEEYETITNATQ